MRTNPGAKQRRMLEVLEQFRVIFKSLRSHYREVQQRTGISGAQLWVLARVAASPGSHVGEVARSLAIHQSTASNLLKSLERRRLVARERRGADQRNVQLYATAKGLRLLRRAPQPLIGVLQQALTELPAPVLAGLHVSLARVIAAMKVKRLAAARAMPLSEM
jgi:DNA-binding MarR family transcriptional regulator